MKWENGSRECYENSAVPFRMEAAIPVGVRMKYDGADNVELLGEGALCG